MENKTLGCIGVGRMASAILTGAIDNNILPADKINLFDKNIEQAQRFFDKGCKNSESIEDLTKHSNIILLAVKPQNFTEVLPLIRPNYSSDKIIVSIAAGITDTQIENALGGNAKVVLAMPNTPLLLAKGATALARNSKVTEDEFDYLMSLFGAVGVVEEVKLNQLNSAIAINGSTPAFIYKFADIIVSYAHSQGVDSAKAMALFAQTLVGSAAMLTQTNSTPQELINMVCSPGGATIEGMKALEENGFDKAVVAACSACIKRAEKLSEESGE